MTDPLHTLRDTLADERILDDPTVEDSIVYGRAHLDAAGVDVSINIDPELEDVEDVDWDALYDGVKQLLAIEAPHWAEIMDAVAAEIAEDDGDVDEAELRADLEPTSVVVFAEATLISLVAQRQFSDTRILLQLDENLELENVQVGDDDVETIVFASIDDLLDHISAAD